MGLLSNLMYRLRHTPGALGRQGELLAAKQLSRANFWGYRGKILHNVYVPQGQDKTTEIDLLYLTKKGIFVLESKNYSGQIYGSETSPYWTSTWCTGRTWLGRPKLEKHRFYNPVWQNQTHINVLSRYLSQSVPMISLVVFSDRCSLRQIPPNEREMMICPCRRLFRCIRRAWRRHASVLTAQELDELYQQLLPLTNPGYAVKRKHVRDVKKRSGQALVCPLCGGRLVLRTAHSGAYAGRQFYGCSNYPSCRYLRDF